METNNLDNAIDSYHQFIKTLLLMELAEKCIEKKDIFLKNTLAKSSSLLQSINTLYRIENYFDGWILYRAMTDRLLHLFYLEEQNSYNEFSKWSFIRDFEENNRARSDPNFRRVLSDPLFVFDESQRKKYEKYKSEGISWKRPDPEKVLKDQGLDFIYKFGYDYASKHTHPMYNDGNYEFHKITGLEPNPFNEFPKENLIRNSLLLSTMIAQTSMNFMTFKFREVCYNYLESLRMILDGDLESYKINQLKILHFVEGGFSLSE